jgi:demethylmenaquinone methyltransferase/2-methoxy-6-polyprenyl-1,4-benzoquinol methylase
MNDSILEEQIQYYRARAQEYDASIVEATDLLAPGRILLLNLGTFDSILELACGTGIWTETLLQMGNKVIAVDAAPEMLDIAHQKLGEERIQYQQADLFHWQPDRQYDLVFFANWLSHVPPDGLDTFLSKVQRAVQPGGCIAMIDQHRPSDSDRRIAKDDIYATRPIQDGRQFTIVKAFYDLEYLRNKFESLGFEVHIDKFTGTFFFLTGKTKGI